MSDIVFRLSADFSDTCTATMLRMLLWLWHDAYGARDNDGHCNGGVSEVTGTIGYIYTVAKIFSWFNHL